MRLLTTSLTLLLCVGSAFAQENALSVNASSSVEVPADGINFNININAEAGSPQEAYDLHQQREKVLIDLLRQHDIPEEDIQFEPVAINRVSTRREDPETRVRTRQQVSLGLSDFTEYEAIQIALIENGYDEFSGNFTSSESDTGRDQALKEALGIARNKAELIAQESDIVITSVKSINYSHHDAPPRPLLEAAAFSDKSAGSLVTEYDQMVTVSATVSIQYDFKQK
ncbi:SIMPL domain-containing protein [Fodinibius sediminis]|uniref:Uncharacterized conserved protein YggE, contains kinase-interacting SIMPL domain n=1 Tax=Fodinibius sediminis TaxID=1214077 RepID=A0A521B872_9BACT|nr:SIMPL domain-containing protein [Fodinibius sediminis]SMO43298.1 Uncharacterized conserved protein YggE, contains kinase-interacting SIMPL domain [Fodinibius sediminis]